MSEVGSEELRNIERDPGRPEGDGRPVEERSREPFDPSDEDIPDEETIEGVGY